MVSDVSADGHSHGSLPYIVGTFGPTAYCEVCHAWVLIEEVEHVAGK